MSKPFSVGDAIEFIRGVTFTPDQLVDLEAEDAVVCMRTKNVQKDLDETDLIAVPRALVRRKDKYLQPGDTLLSIANSWELVGKCSYVGELAYQATAGGFISIVRPKRSKTHPRFLYHWLSSKRMQFVLRHLGRQTTNISNLDVSRFKLLDFPRIDYANQERIAKILDKADGIRRKREQALLHADQFLSSAFLLMFGDPVQNPKEWEQNKLSDCATFISGATPSKSAAAYWDGEVPWVSPKDMKVDLIFDAQDHVAELAFTETNLKKVPENTPLIVVRGMILAHTVPIALTMREVAINQDMKAIQFDRKIDPMFGFWCLKVLQKKILSVVDSAAHGTKRIDMSRLGEVPIHIPDGNLQRKFVSLVKKHNEVRGSLTKALSDASDMFASLSQRALRGEL